MSRSGSRSAVEVVGSRSGFKVGVMIGGHKVGVNVWGQGQGGDWGQMVGEVKWGVGDE